MRFLLRRIVLRKLVAEPVVVHAKSGTSIRGILRRVDRECIVLSNAVLLSEARRTDLDGEQVILLDNVDFMQHVSAESAFGEAS